MTRKKRSDYRIYWNIQCDRLQIEDKKAKTFLYIGASDLIEYFMDVELETYSDDPEM